MPHPYSSSGWQPPPLPPAAPSALTAARRRVSRMQEAAARAELHQELRHLVGRVQGLLAGRGILELACGVGWWTRQLAEAGQSVLAMDDDADLVRAAAAGRYPAGRVRFVAADLMAVERLPGACDAGFAALLTSGLGEPEAAAVLAALHRRLGPGAQVVLVDERGAGGGAGEAAVRRRLRDIAPDAQRVKLDLGAHFWCLCYTL